MKDAFWFPHDSNARNDPKMSSLRRKAGVEGVGLYWCIIELMRETNGYVVTREDISNLEYDMRVSQENLPEIMLKEELLHKKKDGNIFSKSLLKRMQKWDNIKKKRSEAGKKGGIASGNRRSKKKANVKQTLSKAQAKPKQNEAITEQNRTEQNRTREDKHSYPENFEKFWSAYPNKKGKKNALLAFAKATDKPDIEQLVSIIGKQKKTDSWIKENGKFIPHPTTWLNAGSWDDETQQQDQPAWKRNIVNR